MKLKKLTLKAWWLEMGAQIGITIATQPLLRLDTAEPCLALNSMTLLGITTVPTTTESLHLLNILSLQFAKKL